MTSEKQGTGLPSSKPHFQESKKHSLPPIQLAGPGLLQLVNDLVISLFLDGSRILFINPAGEDIFGRKESELTHATTDWMEFVHQDDAESLSNDICRIQESETFAREFRVKRPDQSLRWLSATFSLIKDPNGKPQAIGGVAKDVSERVATEQELLETKAVYHSLVESLPINVFRKDRQGRIVFGNKKYSQSFGLTQEGVVGKTDHDLFDAIWADKYQKDDAWVLQTGLPFHDIEHHPNPDGTTKYVEVLKAAVTDNNGRRVGIQGMYWDVTARKEAEVKMREARDLAEAASNAKSDFLANVSHEIRTPMNAIIGLTDLLLESGLDREKRDYLKMIQQSGESLLTLINDILDFSKIESGKLQIEKFGFDLRNELADTLRSLAPRAHSKRIEIIVDFAADIPPRLIGDLNRIRQVLVNLTSNAIKFTDKGEVVVSVRCVKIENGIASLRFSVRDTGIGIPEEKRETIFQQFEQADTSITRKYGGTGLGLAISSKLVQLMGGQLKVTSETTVGSEFYFSLDLAADETQTRPEINLEGFSVLIAAENRTHLNNVESLLKSWGMTTFSANSIDKAVKTLKGMSAAEQPINVVVSDARFEAADGSVLANKIASDENLRGTGIILLTSSRATELVYDRSELPIDVQLLKPVKESDLFEALQISLGILDSQTTIHSRKSVAKDPARQLKVLIAEDNAVNQKLAVALLRRDGYQTVVAADGQEAIDSFQREPFDIVLMDVQMPNVDGFEAARTIREWESNGSRKRTPIVAVTAHAGQPDRDKCLAAGMDRFLPKPIRANELAALIVELTGASTHSTGDSNQQDDSNDEFGTHVDWNHAFETVGGDKRLLRDIVTVFLDEKSKMTSDIRRAVDSQNAKELRLSAHSMKGALTHLGAMKAAHFASRLETMGTEGDLEESKKTLDLFERTLKQLTVELDRFKNES